MRLRILFFGILRERFGPEQSLDLPLESSVGTVLNHFHALSPAMKDLWPSLAVAVNQQYASATSILSDGDEVALLPPVSGGTAMLP